MIISLISPQIRDGLPMKTWVVDSTLAQDMQWLPLVPKCMSWEENRLRLWVTILILSMFSIQGSSAIIAMPSSNCSTGLLEFPAVQPPVDRGDAQGKRLYQDCAKGTTVVNTLSQTLALLPPLPPDKPYLPHGAVAKQFLARGLGLTCTVRSLLWLTFSIYLISIEPISRMPRHI
jgi:hypothetical protein